MGTRGILDSLTSVEEKPIEAIYGDLSQPRSHFDLRAIANMSNSIKEVGLIKPILVERIEREEGAKTST